jgi:t-SNARE complex subunit (syntaxin)
VRRNITEDGVMSDLCKFLQKRMEGNKETTNLRELAYVRCGEINDYLLLLIIIIIIIIIIIN